MEYIKNLQKHGSSKCIILTKFERELLKITNSVKVTIDNKKITIEAIVPEGNEF